jgi:hypothetical protein
MVRSKRRSFDNERNAYESLVWQCRYSAIEVPDALLSHAEIGVGKLYADTQADSLKNEPVSAQQLTDEQPVVSVESLFRVAELVEELASACKGSVKANKYRRFSASNPAECAGNSSTKTAALAHSGA